MVIEQGLLTGVMCAWYGCGDHNWGYEARFLSQWNLACSCVSFLLM